MEQLKIEYVDKSELKMYANNAKIHTAEQVDQIKKSIEEVGFNDPIAVWHDNEIIEGHGRLLAVMEMDEIQEVPIIRLDHLTDNKRKAYMLIHNKLTMNTDFDDDLLGAELDDITDIDMSDFGFIEEEEGQEEKKQPEVEFTEVLGEENNYIVLKFNEDIDWLQLQSIFPLKTVKSYSTRKDGKIIGKMHRCGIGRVVDGAEFLNSLGVEI